MFSKEKTSVIEGSYPNPIASAVRKIRLIDTDDSISRHDLLGDLFEITTKYLAIVLLQDYKTKYSLPIYLDDFLKKMLHPSLGHWNEIIRTISSEEINKCSIGEKVAKFYKTKITQQIKEQCELIQNALSSKLNIKTNKDIFDLFILYRNKAKGHGAKISKEEYKIRLESLEIIMLDLLEGISFFKDYDLSFVDVVQVLPTREYQHKCKVCIGTQIEPRNIIRPDSLTPGHFYVHSKNGEEEYIDLFPLLAMFSCKECKHEEVFVFNDYRKDRLEYLSYSCGHFMYPEMLPNEFEKLFKVSMSSIGGEDISKPQSDEEATEKASKELAQAMGKIASKEYYEALEHLQMAMTFKTTWEANYYSALVLMKMKGSPSEALFHLNACQHIEPDNTLSNKIRGNFFEVFDNEELVKNPGKHQIEQMNIVASEILDDQTYVPNVKPIYYYLGPKWARSFSLLFWVGITILFFIVRGVVAQFLGMNINYVVLFLKSVMVISFFATIYMISGSMKDVYFALLQQLTSKSREKFQEWYQEQIEKTFGKYNDNLSFPQKFNLHLPENRNNFLIVTFLFILGVIGATYLTCYDVSDRMAILFVAIDYSFMFLCIMPGTPIVLKTFLWLRDYSRLPLKPLIGEAAQYSLNKIGRMIFIVSIPYTSIYFSFTLIGYLTFSNNIIGTQLALFYFMVSFGCIWTLITPYSFYLALSKSKEKVLSKYNEHIEDAFKLLLDNPNQNNLDRYHWLKRQQGEFVNLRTGAMSRTVMLGTMGVNAFIIFTAIAYPFVKYKISLEQLIEWFHLVFKF